MVYSLNFLKELDFFKVPVKIFFTKTANNSQRKVFKDKLGSFYGFMNSILVVIMIGLFGYQNSMNYYNGLYDFLDQDIINHNFNENETIIIDQTKSSRFGLYPIFFFDKY